jgi:hypothetical protein
MKKLCYLLLITIVVAACGKEKKTTRVEIYVLKSQKLKKVAYDPIYPTAYTYTHYVENAVLEDTPLIADQNITAYNPKNYTFYIYKDVKK